MSAGESSRVEPPPAKRRRQAAAAADDGSGGDGSAWQLGGDATIETIGAGETLPYPDGKDAGGKSLTPAAPRCAPGARTDFREADFRLVFGVKWGDGSSR